MDKSNHQKLVELKIEQMMKDMFINCYILAFNCSYETALAIYNKRSKGG